MDQPTEISVALPAPAWKFVLEAVAAAALPHEPRASLLAELTARLDAAAKATAPQPEG